jgi:hypothetical protein
MSDQHEETDVNVRAIFGFGAGLTLVMIVVYVAVRLMFVYMDRQTNAAAAPDFPLAAGHETRLPPEPRLQTAPREDLHQLRTREEEKLRTYQWVDRSAGTVRIPIDQAIKLTLERGLPSRPPAPGVR